MIIFVPHYWNERRGMMSTTEAFVDRLVAATNAHDVEGIAACFTEDYENTAPAHPQRSFRGREQVRRNWEQILAFVPALAATLLARVVEGGGLDRVGDDRDA